VNRRDTEPYVRWCGRTVRFIPHLLPDRYTQTLGLKARHFKAWVGASPTSGGPGKGLHNPSKPCKGVTSMSQSLANIIVHLVFSTKDRRPLLRDEERAELHAYIAGILKNNDSPLIEINSVRDHVHILFAQSKNHAPAKIVADQNCVIDMDQNTSFVVFGFCVAKRLWRIQCESHAY
jgi:REP element-mobilizing transposase RayT